MLHFKKVLQHKPLTTTINGICVRVKKGVFDPDPTKMYSTKFLLDYLPDSFQGKTVVDVGCGCGVLSIYAALAQAKYVLGVDIQRKALLCTKENVSRHGLESIVSVKKSNVFSHIHKQYDVVVANLPISDIVWKKKSFLFASSFIKNFSSYVKPGGKAYFTWASFGSNKSLVSFQEQLQKQNYSFSFSKIRKLNHDWFIYDVSL